MGLNLLNFTFVYPKTKANWEQQNRRVGSRRKEMTPRLLYELIINPTLGALGAPFNSREAAVLLGAIYIQESGLKHRRQMPRGPARGYCQIEPPTAIDVLGRSKPIRDFCASIGVKAPKLGSGGPDILREYDDNVREFRCALQYCDAATCAIARGILLLEPSPLPIDGDIQAGWKYYLKCWRPGKPRAEAWEESYRTAINEQM